MAADSRNAVLLAVVGVALFARVAVGQQAPPPAAATVPGSRPACVGAQVQVRMQAFGYDHFVTLRNACDRRVTCEVSTSVAPRPVTATVDAGASTDVLTWRGSPAREFAARVDCR